MEIEVYKSYRATGMELANKILQLSEGNKKEMIFAGTLLGFWNGNTMIWGSDDDMDVMMDFSIYENNSLGLKLMDKFYESDVELNGMEEELLEGMMNAHPSVFEIKSIDQPNFIVTLTNLLDSQDTEYQLMDLGFSQTGRTGMVIYTRLIPLQDINMTSGVSFGFGSDRKAKILADIAFAKFKKRGKLGSSELFVLVHQKSMQYGKKVVKMWSPSKP
jgi:hypothetical protein